MLLDINYLSLTYIYYVFIKIPSFNSPIISPITQDNKVPHTHKHEHKEGDKVHIHEKDRYGVDKIENKPVDYDKKKYNNQLRQEQVKKIRIQISGYLRDIVIVQMEEDVHMLK